MEDSNSSESECEDPPGKGGQSMKRQRVQAVNHRPPHAKSSKGGQSMKRQRVQAVNPLQGSGQRLHHRPPHVKSSKGAKQSKRKWSTEEVKAVESSLMEFIRMGRTPGKQDCEKCIAASPQALSERDWKGVKFFVYNRIVSERRM